MEMEEECTVRNGQRVLAAADVKERHRFHGIGIHVSELEATNESKVRFSTSRCKDVDNMLPSEEVDLDDKRHWDIWEGVVSF